MSSWQGKSRGTHLGYRIFVWILKSFGVQPAYFLLRFVAFYYFLFSYTASKQADTIVFLEKGKAYTYAGASIRICKYLDWPAKAMYAFIIIPGFISQSFYKWFARHRYKWFGKKESCMVPTAEVRERFLG